MPQFILSFRSAKTYNALTDPGALPAWVKYLNEVIAPNVADPGWPVFEPATVIGEAGPSTQLGGYLIVTADDPEAAVSIAKSCPNIEHGGGVEVGLLADLPPGAPRRADALPPGRRRAPTTIAVSRLAGPGSDARSSQLGPPAVSTH